MFASFESSPIICPVPLYTVGRLVSINNEPRQYTPLHTVRCHSPTTSILPISPSSKHLVPFKLPAFHGSSVLPCPITSIDSRLALPVTTFVSPARSSLVVLPSSASILSSSSSTAAISQSKCPSFPVQVVSAPVNHNSIPENTSDSQDVKGSRPKSMMKILLSLLALSQAHMKALSSEEIPSRAAVFKAIDECDKVLRLLNELDPCLPYGPEPRISRPLWLDAFLNQNDDLFDNLVMQACRRPGTQWGKIAEQMQSSVQVPPPEYIQAINDILVYRKRAKRFAKIKFFWKKRAIKSNEENGMLITPSPSRISCPNESDDREANTMDKFLDLVKTGELMRSTGSYVFGSEKVGKSYMRQSALESLQLVWKKDQLTPVEESTLAMVDTAVTQVNLSIGSAIEDPVFARSHATALRDSQSLSSSTPAANTEFNRVEPFRLVERGTAVDDMLKVLKGGGKPSNVKPEVAKKVFNAQDQSATTTEVKSPEKCLSVLAIFGSANLNTSPAKPSAKALGKRRSAITFQDSGKENAEVFAGAKERKSERKSWDEKIRKSFNSRRGSRLASQQTCPVKTFVGAPENLPDPKPATKTPSKPSRLPTLNPRRSISPPKKRTLPSASAKASGIPVLATFKSPEKTSLVPPPRSREAGRAAMLQALTPPKTAVPSKEGRKKVRILRKRQESYQGYETWKEKYLKEST